MESRFTRELLHAVTQHRLGNFAEARRLYELILRDDKNDFHALRLLGVLEAQERKFQAALRLLDAALEENSNSPDAWTDKGNVLIELRKYDEALLCYQKAAAIYPQHLPALQNEGCTLIVLGRADKALAVFDRMLQIEPRLLVALHNRAIALTELGRYAEAIASCDRALAINSNYPEALQSRGIALEYLRRHDLALPNFKRAASLSPSLEYLLGSLVLSQLYCHEFESLDQNKHQLIERVRRREPAATPFAFLSMSDSPADQLTCSKAFIADKHPPVKPPLWRGEIYRHSKIKLAYFCYDFREHPTSYLLAGLFEQHDRARFDTVAISYGPDDKSEIRSRIKLAFDRFVDVSSMSDAEIAALLRGEEIDIVVDLNGLIQHNRMGVLARRPAPIQVHYLGYPGTIGADYIDYLLADRWIIPETHCECYSEQIVYLPHCYQGNDANRKISQVTPTRKECGLPERGFVFCCFNSHNKLTPAIFTIWMRLIAQVPDSVLWIIEGTPTAAENLRREAKMLGITGDRLVFAPKMALPDHLARHRVADLFLDTLPYNAHTTASDALWAGLPVLTCSGSTFAGRVAGSLLNAIGLSELITDSLIQYETKALAIARNANLLASLKTKLAENRNTHPLFDTRQFTRDIEEAFVTMWQRYLRKQPPTGFAVTPTVKTLMI